ncbi:unnamed protein product [Rotaria sp. Silwood2]|nr:unnamed protein product [Rotaria sp. Silwood2]CAF2985120.1 unnamed protein product [Rotaria sp. Silwood2]CAF3110458.1 unnamed protein product [Rotaria sp. Silwood2]CAF3193596.1 unnamed protein product [Rotaria sp. Silwood2]CAF4028995.1 unnamed protein product [Rotaria sp. Silwood2]
MSGKQKSRDKIVFDWFMKDLLGYSGPTIKPTAQQVFMKSLVDVAAADGTFSEQEREWIVGFATISGYPQELVNELEKYEPGQCSDVKNYFQNVHLPYVKKSGLSVIYHGIRAASADGELHAKEIEAIYTLAKKLGINDEQVQQVRAICDEENKLRQKRAILLFPHSFDDALNEFYKHH